MNTYVVQTPADKDTSLKEVMNVAKMRGLADWDSLQILQGNDSSRLTNPEGARPRVSHLEIRGGNIICGLSTFYVGYNLPLNQGRTKITLKDLTVLGLDKYEGGVVDPAYPHSTPGDVFVTCNQLLCDGVQWGYTHNGPVGFASVSNSTIGPLQADALSSCIKMKKVLVRGVKQYRGSHPDVHQITRPDWKNMCATITMEDLDAVDLDCQFLHWSKVGENVFLNSVMTRVVCEQRRPGQVWQSRIGIPLQSIEWTDVDFGQPLQINVPPASRKLSFKNCIFRAGLWPKDSAVKEALNKGSWEGCAFAGGGWQPG